MKENKIPNAEEFLNNQEIYVRNRHVFPLGTGKIMQQNMIEFAKLHVKAALEAALENAPYGSSTDTVSYEDMKDAILEAYPEELIK